MVTKLPLINKTLFLDATFKAAPIQEIESEVADPPIIIEGYASTNSIDRAGDIIVPAAWSSKQALENFKKNPIMLFNHDYNSPIGKVIEVSVDNKGLYIKASISSANEEVYQLIKEGILVTFSVGFRAKEVDYNEESGCWAILDLELLEISVVSVPCNQDALFSLSKSFSSNDEYERFKSQFNKEDTTPLPLGLEKRKMEPEELEKIKTEAQEAARKAYADEQAKLAAETKAIEEAKALEAAKEEKITAKVSATVAEKVAAEVEKRLAESNTSNQSVDLTDLKDQLAATKEEMKAMLANKERFPSTEKSSSWKEKFVTEIENAHLLGHITKKGLANTVYGKNVIEKVNAYSSMTVSSADYEQVVNTSIERDIWLDLILAPMFREIQMTSATQIVPWMGDAGYAEISNAAGSTNGTAPNGTLDSRGGTDRAGIALNEITLRTDKFVSKAYLVNETEEDAIIPILPLIRENMIRQHVRAVENVFLLGGHADGQFTTTLGSKGLIKYANANATEVAGPSAASGKVTAAHLLSLRRKLGKYGLRPSDLVYVVSQDAYFDLLEDPEYQDFQLVQSMATKLTGEVGNIYGSPVMICDEFKAKAANKHCALALNKRNFVVPRLRGVTSESDYLVEQQHRVMVTTQRLGFTEIIPGATSVAALTYTA